MRFKRLFGMRSPRPGSRRGLDSRHLRQPGPVPHPLGHRIDGGLGTFEHRLDAAIRPVAYPPREAEALAASAQRYRNPTPCTRPLTRTRRRIIPPLSRFSILQSGWADHLLGRLLSGPEHNGSTHFAAERGRARRVSLEQRIPWPVRRDWVPSRSWRAPSFCVFRALR